MKNLRVDDVDDLVLRKALIQLNNVRFDSELTVRLLQRALLLISMAESEAFYLIDIIEKSNANLNNSF